jgi:hypothetical protein
MMMMMMMIILGTSHIIRKVLQAETWSLSGGVHHWLKRRSTREERKPVLREQHQQHNNNNNNNNTLLTYRFCVLVDKIKLRVYKPACAWHYINTYFLRCLSLGRGIVVECLSKWAYFATYELSNANDKGRFYEYCLIMQIVSCLFWVCLIPSTTDPVVSWFIFLQLLEVFIAVEQVYIYFFLTLSVTGRSFR